MGTRHLFIEYILNEHLDLPGSVVGIRDIEGNQKLKGFTFTELIFHEEKTDNRHIKKDNFRW